MSRESVTEEQPVEYTDDEKAVLLDLLMALRSTEIRPLLELHELPKSGNKKELRERVLTAIEHDSLTYSAILRWIDRWAPWGKQHVFLYDGPEGSMCDNWDNADWVQGHLGRHGVSHLLEAPLLLALPEDLTLSAIEWTEGFLRVTAVERRDYWERNREDDEQRHKDTGEEVELRAFVHHVTRGLVIFEWDLNANIAALRISQLPSGTKYEGVAQRFGALVHPWLSLARFALIDINRTIRCLHQAEQRGHPEARSHAIDYSTVGGRRLSGKSPSARDSVLGEALIDEALANMSNEGVGHLGNFYWLPRHIYSGHNNPLDNEVHVFLVASKHRIGFPTPNMEADVRHVLSRIRALSN